YPRRGGVLPVPRGAGGAAQRPEARSNRLRPDESKWRLQGNSPFHPRHGCWFRLSSWLTLAWPRNRKHERAGAFGPRRILDPLSARARHGSESVRPLAEGSVARGIVLDPLSIGCNLRMFWSIPEKNT